jgi:hypothetical protein
VAKAAAIFVIALVLVAGVLLRPVPRDMEGPAPIPARAIAVHVVARPGVVLRSESVQNAFKVDSEPVQSRFKVDSESVQSSFRVGPEYGYGSTQVGRTNALAKLRTSTMVADPLPGRPLPASAAAAPVVSRARRDAQGTGDLTRAFDTVADHTAGAFRTAGRALRSVF